MWIKFFSFLSLIPLYYILYKFIKRRDFNAFDIFLSFQILYFAIIPLTGDVEDIMYDVVRNDFSTQLETFVQINLFLYSILFIDIYYTNHTKKQYGSLLNVTERIREWGERFILNDKIYLLVFFIIAILIGHSLMNMVSGEDVLTIDEGRERGRETNTMLGLMLKSIVVFLRPFLAQILTTIAIQRKQIFKSVPFGLAVLSCGMVLIMGARTWLFEFLLVIVIVYYSHRKNRITNKTLMLVSVVIVLMISLLFPILSAFKYSKMIVGKEMLTGSNPIEVTRATVDYIIKNEESIESFDNKDQRKWFVYQIVGLSLASDYQGNGELTMKSLSFQMPRVIFPMKDMEGSQIAIEKGLKVYEDVADSILLFGVTENKYLGFFISTLIVLLIFSTFNIVHLFFRKREKNPFIFLFILSSFFIILDQPEWSVDKFLTMIIYLLSGSVIILLLWKMVPRDFFIVSQNYCLKEEHK